ncbi:MAG: T9SS type A sorting domain-containing protein [Filimonas sp.]|nr:T9SS type A sorting domain-containing protein [Filimonas sp.]
MRHFLLMLLSLICFSAIAGKRIYLKKNSGGTSIQINNALDSVILTNNDRALIKAGDTIVLNGTYGAINIFNLRQGTPGNEVVVINEGQVIVNGKTGGTPVNLTCINTKFLFNLDPLYPYGLKVTGASPTSILSTAIKLFDTLNSRNYEMAGVEIMYASRGLFENPQKNTTASHYADNDTLSNIYIHDCYFHDLIIPDPTTGTGEAIYFGYSSTANNPYDGSPRFYNLRIERCRFENIDGDGAQIKRAQVTVKDCYFNNTGKALVSGQGDAVQFGEYAYGKIQNNRFVNCRQHAILHKGTDTTYIINNSFDSISNKGATNDIVYINTTPDTTRSPKMVIYMHDNTFDLDTLGRALINNAGNNNDQNVSYYYQNCYSRSQAGNSIFFILKPKDQFTACVIPTTKEINVNITGTAIYNNTAWNNWTVGTGQNTGTSEVLSDMFHYADGAASTITALLSSSKGVSDWGTGYTTSLAPDSVIRYASNSTSPSRTLTINGLSSSKTYTIELYASNKVAGIDTTNYTIFSIGAAADTVLTANNLTHKSIFAGISADSTGKIVITSKRLGLWTFLNGFKIIESTGNSGLRTANKERVEATTTNENTPDSLKNTQAIVVFPNPTPGNFTLTLNNIYKGELKVSIYDLSGRVLADMTYIKDQPTFSKTINLGNLPSGIYLLKTQIGTWKETKKIIRQ